MARIRSLKPEAFQSDTLAEVSLAAERTFYGMSTLADDRGRLADKPAVVNGALWAVRSEHELHTAKDLDNELSQLDKAGAICRYVGCDGKRYLHFITWDEHQKVDRASRSRAPRCPHHRVDDPERDYCGRHGAEECPTLPPTPPRGRGEAPQASAAAANDTEHSVESRPGAHNSRDTPQDMRESSENPRESSRVPVESPSLDLGPRTVDRGSFQPSAAEPPARPDAATPGPDPFDEIDGLTLTQRSKRITDAYAAAEPLCKWPAINGLVLKAIKVGKWADSEIRDALMRLAAEGRSVTTDTLRVELQGFPARDRPGGGTSAPSRNAQIIDAAMARAIAAEKAMAEQAGRPPDPPTVRGELTR